MIAMVTGSAVIGGEFFLTGCTSGAKTDTGFTPANIALLDEIGETILPATSSPGAKAAHVGEFMKLYVNDCYPRASQDVFMKGIVDLENASRSLHKKSFIDCSAEQRNQLLLKLEEQSKSHNKTLDEKERPLREAA